MKRCLFGGPCDTPDSNGTPRARVRWPGFWANQKDMPIIDAGMSSAKSP